jgi:hypothetical protein
MADCKNVAPMAHNYRQNRPYRWLHWLACGNAGFFRYRREDYRKGMAGNERALRSRDPRSGIFLNFRHSVVFFVAKFANYAENIESRITEWLDAFGLTRQRLSEPACHFAYRVIVQTNVPLLILRTRGHDRYLTLIANVSFTPEEKTLFDNLVEPKKKNLFAR